MSAGIGTLQGSRSPAGLRKAWVAALVAVAILIAGSLALVAARDGAQPAARPVTQPVTVARGWQESGVGSAGQSLDATGPAPGIGAGAAAIMLDDGNYRFSRAGCIAFRYGHC